MFGCVRSTRDRYNSLAIVAVVVGLLIFGLIIITIILHMALLWLVLVAAIIMLITAFGYSTCSGKVAHVPSQQQSSTRSDSISTISNCTAETGSTEDFPPCYEVVVKENYHVSPDNSTPPSYLDAVALQRYWSDNAIATPHFNKNIASRQHLDTSSRLASFSISPPPYEEHNTSTCDSDRLSETTQSTSENTSSLENLSEDTSSLGDVSGYTMSSHSSVTSLYLDCDAIKDNLEMISIHYSGRGCASQHYQAELHLGKFSNMPSIANIC